ncbi:MAG: multiple sugar transport system substrate-binding protein, partial [Chloroflexota bacterium]|nr:multiple sugar transport system substrate-binding protein [Chloroflexota bacterium]
TDPKIVDYFDVTKKYYDIMGPDQVAGLRQAEGMGGWGGSFNAKAQAMITEGYWHAGETMVQAPEVAKFNKSSWALVIDANKGKKVQEAGGHTLGVFKNSKYPKEAFKLGEFFNQNGPLDTIFKQVGWILGKKTWLEKNVKPDAYPGLDFVINKMGEVTDWFQLRRCPLHGYLWNQLGEVREMIYRGKLTPAQGAAEMQKRAETEWKNQGLPTG